MVENRYIQTFNRKIPIQIFFEKHYKVIRLLDDGNDTFNNRFSERIFQEHFQELELNKCPRCNKIARTPEA